jgi:hypothetical protein
MLVTAFTLAGPASADTLDSPTQSGTITQAAPVTNSVRKGGAGFRAYTYTVSKDGFLLVKLNTTLINASDNEGKAWRPFLRIIRLDGTAEAWSTNGHQDVKTTGQSSLAIRVKAGDKLTLIATLALNNDKKASSADANFTLSVKEVSP